MNPTIPNIRNNKRPAEPFHEILPLQDPTPQVVRRHHHRRRNIASTIWGPEIVIRTAPSIPPTPPEKVPFNVYKAILHHPNLFFEFALRLPYKLIIALYAIDKEFHYRLNKYSVSLIRDYTNYHAPRASFVFGWLMHPELCISDPMLRPMDGREWLARDVPGFRWVGMVIWRERIVRDILGILAREGHRVPARMAETVMKLWSLMEINTIAMRALMLDDKSIWTDVDILLVHMFVMKLDMRFADPVLGNGACALSHVLLSQKCLSSLWKVLTGKVHLDYDSVTRLVVRTYLFQDLNTADHPWLEENMEGVVRRQERGLLSRENWHVDGAPMDTALDMVYIEGLSRGLTPQQFFLDFALYGYVDPVTRKNIPVPMQWRLDETMTTPVDGWPSKSTFERTRTRLNQAIDRVRAALAREMAKTS